MWDLQGPGVTYSGFTLVKQVEPPTRSCTVTLFRASFPRFRQSPDLVPLWQVAKMACLTFECQYAYLQESLEQHLDSASLGEHVSGQHGLQHW